MHGCQTSVVVVTSMLTQINFGKVGRIRGHNLNGFKVIQLLEREA